MTLVIADRVKETTTTTGTGTLTLAGAATQFQSFSTAIGNGNTTYYTLIDGNGTDWEVGLGTVGAGTLTRTRVDASTNGNAALALSAHTHTVFCGATAKFLTPRDQAKAQLQWISGAVVANGVVYFIYDTPYSGTILGMQYFTGNGSFVATVDINNAGGAGGTPVTGLSSITVNSATATFASATGSNTFSKDATISGVIASASGSPTDALLNLLIRWDT
jgi:hypothetical protein